MNRKRLLFIPLLGLLLFTLYHFRDLKYGIGQAIGQLEVIYNSEPIEEYLQDPSTPDSLKQKIKLIEEVRSYAIDSIGMTNSDNYNTIYNQHDSDILWVVNAGHEFEIKSYEWCFPIAGCFPYKGFFNKESALKESLKMQEKGYDTYIRAVDGWSTLGIFNDPILSNMLAETEGELAELIIHELTHSSIYVKDSADFNENLASFIGEVGAIVFLKDRFGINSKEYKHYSERLHDSRLFEKKMFRCIVQIERFYKSLNKGGSSTTNKMLKNEVIKENICSINRNDFYHPNRYKWLELNEFFPNNAYFSLFLTYNTPNMSIEDGFEHHNRNLKSYFKELKKKYAK